VATAGSTQVSAATVELAGSVETQISWLLWLFCAV
jgi:hypothetical protein